MLEEAMELGNNLINTKFDEIDGKIDFMIELCQELQVENQELQDKIKQLETELDARKHTERDFSEQESLVQSKIEGLLKKLDGFSNDRS